MQADVGLLRRLVVTEAALVQDPQVDLVNMMLESLLGRRRKVALGAGDPRHAVTHSDVIVQCSLLK